MADAGRAGGVRGDEPLSVVLPALAAWRRRRQQQSLVDGRWQYQVSWLPVTGLGDGAMPGGRWLLVVPAALAGGGLAAECAQVLAEGGAQVVTVTADGEAGAGPAGAGGDTGGGGGRGAVGGVVSLLALDEAGGSAGCRGVPAAVVAGTLLLVQALGDAGIWARLWAVTCGAVADRAGTRAG